MLKDALLERFDDNTNHWNKEQYISKLNYEAFIEEMIEKELEIDFGPQELDKTTKA